MKEVQEQHGEADAQAADEVEEQESAGPTPVPGRIFRGWTERPQLVPQEVIRQGGLGG